MCMSATWLHMAAWASAVSSPAQLQGLESELQEFEGILQHLVQLLTPLRKAGLLVLHLKAFKMLSDSAFKERKPTGFWPCSVWAVLFQRPEDTLHPVLVLGQRVGFLT